MKEENNVVIDTTQPATAPLGGELPGTPIVPESAPETVPETVVPETPAPVAKVPEGMVLVSKEELDAIKAQMIFLNRKVDQTADKNRLATFSSKEKKTVNQICRISYYRDQAGDRLIMGWGNMIANIAKYGKNFEQVDQRTTLFLRDTTKKEDGTLKYDNGIIALEVPYTSFSQNKFQEEVEILGKNALSDGRVIFKVLKPDGEEIEMDSKFVN